jgi:hypothetical protein
MKPSTLLTSALFALATTASPLNNYLASCSDCYYDTGDLHCQCGTGSNGQEQATYIDLNNCVANTDGALEPAKKYVPPLNHLFYCLSLSSLLPLVPDVRLVSDLIVRRD